MNNKAIFLFLCFETLFWYFAALAGAVTIKDNDISNWLAMSLEIGYGIPVALLIGSHFFKKDQDIDKQKEMKKEEENEQKSKKILASIVLDIQLKNERIHSVVQYTLINNTTKLYDQNIISHQNELGKSIDSAWTSLQPYTQDNAVHLKMNYGTITHCFEMIKREIPRRAYTAIISYTEMIENVCRQYTDAKY